MDFTTFMVTVFCLIDDWLKTQPKLRQRGPQPTLADSEVLTIEVVGAFMGIDTDKGLYLHFRRHYGDWFPALRQVHRTTFTRQMANLWLVKERLWQYLLTQLDFDPAVFVIDSFPVPVCRFARAYRCKRLREWSAWGYDDTIRQRFFGMRSHVLVCWPGVIVGVELRPADVHDRWVAEDMLSDATGWALGDRNYWSPVLRDQLAERGLRLIAPRKSSVSQPHPWPKWLIQTRRRIETVIGQLTERYHAKRVWARDIWHLCSRWLRRILSHTLAVLLCQQFGLDSPLQFAALITD
jgi:hypothetical protein